MSFLIRRARAGDAEALSAVAHAAKRHWEYPESWIEAWREELTVAPEYIRRHPVFVVTRVGVVVGFYALEMAGRTASLAHLWVEPRSIGGGFGRRLFEHACERARVEGGEGMVIDSDPNAAGFYRRLGAIEVGSVDAAMDGVERRRPQFRLPLRKDAAAEGSLP